MKKCTECNEKIEAYVENCPKCEAAAVMIPKPAGFWIRVLASSIDMVPFIPLMLFANFNNTTLKSIAVNMLLVIPGLLYKPFMESYYGATLGKMALKLMVVGEDGKKINLKRSYVRYSITLLSILVSLIGSMLLFNMPEFATANSIAAIGTLRVHNPVSSLESIINFLIILDCLVVAFTYRKQAIHDKISKSYCIYKDQLV